MNEEHSQAKNSCLWYPCWRPACLRPSSWLWVSIQTAWGSFPEALHSGLDLLAVAMTVCRPALLLLLFRRMPGILMGMAKSRTCRHRARQCRLFVICVWVACGRAGCLLSGDTPVALPSGASSRMGISIVIDEPGAGAKKSPRRHGARYGATLPCFGLYPLEKTGIARCMPDII